MSKLYDTFKDLQDRPALDIKALWQQVEEHFDTIAGLIAAQDKQAHIAHSPQRLADYVYRASLHGQVQDETVALLQGEVDALRAENAALQEHMNAMEHSSSWKITAPIRKVVDALHR